MDDIDIDDLQRRMEGAINSLTKDFQGLRTGEYTQLLDSILVEVYGATMPVNQVATVSVPDLACCRYKFGIKIMLSLWKKL